MPSDANQELTDEEDIHLLKMYYSIYDRFRSEISVSIIPWLIVSAIFFICCRYLLRTMISLCNSNSGGIHYMSQERAVEMIQYFNPFHFCLHVSNASYAGIECTISSTDDCYVVPLWGVPIYELFKLIGETSFSDLQQSICDFAFQSKCMSSNDYFTLPGGKEIRKEFRPSQGFDSNAVEALPSPRLHYPFVLIMLSKHFPAGEKPQLVLLANVVHIPDQVVKLPAQLYQQFCRSADGTVAVIKKIYPGSFDASHTENETVELCLVCMHREISIVIIPCGHACVCLACFESCETCPICRGHAHFYFESCAVSRR